MDIGSILRGGIYRGLRAVLRVMLLLPGVITTGVINGTCTTAGLLPVFITPCLLLVLLLVVLLQPPHSTPPLGYVLLVY